MVLVVICLLLTIGYVLLMAAYRGGWHAQKTFTVPEQYAPATFISVIIPARNEQEHIGACVASVLAQQYPKHLFEVIVVDDHSEDGTADVVAQYAGEHVRCIKLADHLPEDARVNAYKKAAIAAGISVGKGALIVTTDADCTMPSNWLLEIAALYERQQPVMIVAPVTYTSDNSMLHQFQLIDFMSMQGITAAAHQMKLGRMSNGANLAFSKAAYERVGGYEGIMHLASGDDYLLMMKLSQLPGSSIVYLKSEHAIVTTAPQPTWKGFLQQRIRWASKSGKYDDKRLTAILLLVYLFNAMFAVLVIVGVFDHPYLWVALTMLVIKTLVEYVFLVPVAAFFDQKRALRNFALLQPLHIAYIIIAGFLGLAGGYKWKGRAVR